MPLKAKKIRRRDGKTPLHYAARNGRLACAKFLVQQSANNDDHHTIMDVVNAGSGDGTTPLHLACFGGHLDMVRYLVEIAGDTVVHTANDWQCTAAHWASMCRTAHERPDEIRALCTYLHEQHGIPFHVAQSQGHSPLHKAAQHQNRVVIAWMAQHLTAGQKQQAAQPDRGGHCPWDIYQAVVTSDDGEKDGTGDNAATATYAQWMKQEFGGQFDATVETIESEKHLERRRSR